MADLFDAQKPESYMPLAARMRPRELNDYIGQRHLLGEGKPVRLVLEQGNLHSMLLWGPPGVGKTTLAKLMSSHVDAHFISLSAVMSGVKEIRAAVAEAQQVKVQSGRTCVLFVDEVHRFNKSQQDAFLPYIEDGTFVFIGATTENPSFELNNALLSRSRVYLLKNLEKSDLIEVLHSALTNQERGLGDAAIVVDDEQLERIAIAADGDARTALNLLEIAADLAVEESGQKYLKPDAISDVLASGVRKYDKQGDLFFDLISAFHKSVRGSSPDGALYWCCRMLDAGCDPLYIARRLVAIASEDIGNADPRAMQVALNAWDAFERVGPAEGERAIAQAAVYCASAPKSNALYMAYKQCRAEVANSPSYAVPEHLRNAPTSLMKDLGYGDEYRYAHNEPGAFAAGESYLPPEIDGTQWYEPTDRGLEAKISEKLARLEEANARSPQQRYKTDAFKP